MLETYQQEIQRKRRASRIFWLVVFVFATFLYFFFQGYYPSIRFGLQAIEQGKISSGEATYTDIIQSFGIINIRSIPEGATILLGSGAFGNDEKRMVKYGEYSTSISREKYLPVSIDFVIDKTTPYFIEIAHLLDTPRYERRTSTGETFIRLDADTWIIEGQSGKLLTDGTFSGGVAIPSPRGVSIGEGFFLSGAELQKLDTKARTWESVSWSGAVSFIKKCDTLPRVQYSWLICEDEKTILKGDRKIYTGVLRYGNGYIQTGSGIVFDGEKKIYTTGALMNSPRYTSYNYQWYGESGSLLVPLWTGANITPIDTGIEKIDSITNKDGTLVTIGSIGDDYFLSLYSDTGREIKHIIMPFPRVSLEAMRIEQIDGNYLFKMRSTVLFLYHNSKKIQWIVDGDIVAFSPKSALYKTGSGELWHATWYPTGVK